MLKIITTRYPCAARVCEKKYDYRVVFNNVDISITNNFIGVFYRQV